MGKSKKRNFNKNAGKNPAVMKREDIVALVISDLQKNKLSEDTKGLISLFGITEEELSEAGAGFEEISAFRTSII